MGTYVLTFSNQELSKIYRFQNMQLILCQDKQILHAKAIRNFPSPYSYFTRYNNATICNNVLPDIGSEG